MVLFDQAWRNNDVRVLDRINDLLTRNVVSCESRRIDDNVKLARLTARDTNDCNARQTCESRSQDVVSEITQTCLIASVGCEAIAGHREDCEREPLNISDLRGCWQG